jgi:sec-independent protein translocase protein TatC
LGFDAVDQKRPFLQHLGELRRRLIFCAAAVITAMVISYFFYDAWILNFLRGPLDVLSGKEANPFAVNNPLLSFLKSFNPQLKELNLNLHYIGPLEALLVKLKVSFYAGFVLASPAIFYQLWKFISVGLKKGERRAVLFYFPVSILLFLTGILFAYFIILPTGLYFLIAVAGSNLKPMLTISQYTSLVILLSLVFGVVFELPLIVLFLTKIGILSPELLAKKRKYAIIGIFIVSALFTPPDIFTQLMMGIPGIILYELSIWLSRVASKQRKKGTLDLT